MTFKLDLKKIRWYSAQKNKEIMIFAATWIELEMIILGEVSQTEKDKYHMISLKYHGQFFL